MATLRNRSVPPDAADAFKKALIAWHADIEVAPESDQRPTGLMDGVYVFDTKFVMICGPNCSLSCLRRDNT